MSISASSSVTVIVQALLGGAAILALAGAPPREGRMLILSFSGESEAQIAVWASRHGAQIVDFGPMAGSLVVHGRANDLAGTALRHGGIVVAAPSSGCGSGSKK